MGLRRSKKERTRSEILEAAEALFRAHGFADTSIRSIAASVPVSVQTLYNYFPSKEGILAAIAVDRFAAMAQAAEHLRVAFLESQDPDDERDPTQRFLHLVRWGLRGLYEDRDFMRLVFLHARGIAFDPGAEGADPGVAGELREHQRQNRQALNRMFEGIQKSGALRDDVAPDEITDLYILIFTERVARWFQHPEGGIEALEASVVGGLEIVFRGLRPDVDSPARRSR
jgi:AcrR family transcriptional regulator